MGWPGIIMIPIIIPIYAVNVIQQIIANTRRDHSRRRNKPIHTQIKIKAETAMNDADMIICAVEVGAGTLGTARASRTSSVTSRTLSVTGATTEFIHDKAKRTARINIIPQVHIPTTEIATIPPGRMTLTFLDRAEAPP
jgi:hypothetical protein